MRYLETIEERAMRLLLHSGETRPNSNNTKNSITLPIIPFDGDEADKVLQLVLPNEHLYIETGFTGVDVRDSYENSNESYSGLKLSEDSYYEWICEEYLGDKENILTLEEILRLDRLHQGIEDEDDQIRDDFSVEQEYEEESHGAEDAIANDQAVCCSPAGDNDDYSTQTPITAAYEDETFETFDPADGEICAAETDDILSQSTGPIITPANSSGDDEASDYFSEDGTNYMLEMKTMPSEETDISSVFTSASSVVSMSTPAIMRLKARKRRLERFLSEKSLGENREQSIAFLRSIVVHAA